MSSNCIIENKDDPKVILKYNKLTKELDKIGLKPGDTCCACVQNNNCPFAFDPFNSNGDCLQDK